VYFINLWDFDKKRASVFIKKKEEENSNKQPTQKIFKITHHHAT